MTRDSAFLKSQIRDIMRFYDPVVIDREYGGYINQLRDDGSIFDRMTKHLVGTCRFIYNYAVSGQVLDNKDYIASARHGVDFLQTVHRQGDGSYAWVLQGRAVEDATRHCYGHAFVLLAAATAAKAGVEEARPMIDDVYRLLEDRFFDPGAELYVDVIHPDSWSAVDPYRGQNANMHMCEAMLAAYETTGEARYRDRARTLARRICVDLAGPNGGMIWEHYHADWSADWTYNIDDPQNLFRPYGYVAGHFVEWSKLLITLHRHQPETWMVECAEALFKVAMERTWDSENGGLHYTFGPDGAILDTDRYYWVVAEAIAAAALLGVHTGDSGYWSWYDRLWDYADRFFIDHTYGGWYRILDVHGRKYSDLKSPPSKTDYHPLSACYLAMQATDSRT